MYTVQCTIIVQCTLYNVQLLYNVHCTMYNYCTMYTVEYTILLVYVLWVYVCRVYV
jgi:hypothetical protein